MRFDGSDRNESGGKSGRRLVSVCALAATMCLVFSPAGAQAIAVETPLGGVEVGLDEDGVDVGASVPSVGTDIEANVGAGEDGVSIDAQVNTPAVDVTVGDGGGTQSSGGPNTSDERGTQKSESAGAASEGASADSSPGRDNGGRTSRRSDSNDLGSLRANSGSTPQTPVQQASSLPVAGLVALVASRTPLPNSAGAASTKEGPSVVAQLVAYIPTWLWVALGLLVLTLIATAAYGLREHRRRRAADHVATLDPLTKIANVKAFDERLAHEWSRSNRYGGPLGVLMIDLDRFKEVNDVHGHSAGDKVLITVARELSGRTRDTDFVARVGGDEFAVICPHTTLSGLQKLREQLEVELPPAIGFGVGVSIGAAEMKDLDSRSSEMVQRADAAMYARKSSRRGAPAPDEVLANTG